MGALCRRLFYRGAQRTLAPNGAIELELELIQSHMAQKPVLRGEVGCACVAREVSVERDRPRAPMKAVRSALLPAGTWGASEKRAFSELQLTGIRLARRKQEGGPALRAFMSI